MEKLLLITGALMVGGIFGFFLAACLSMGRDPRPDPLPEGEGMLRQTPEEITAGYERKGTARRALTEKEKELNAVKAWRAGHGEGLKAWEKEQDRKEKRRMR